MAAQSNDHERIVSVSDDGRTSFVIAKARLRHHKKSRNGCLVCKARRVKCQEQRPVCSNCSKVGAACTYQSETTQIAVVRGLTNSPIEPANRRLWHHFVVHFADPNGIYYHGETAGPWLQDIPARGIQYPSLQNAIMAFSSSHLGHTTGTPGVSKCLTFRQKALSELSRVMGTSLALSQAEKDAVLSTCLVLRFQCYYLDDGLVEMLTLRRLSFALAVNSSENLKAPQKGTLTENAQGSAQGTKTAQFLLDRQLNPMIISSAIRSLKRLEDPVKENKTLTDIYTAMMACLFAFAKSDLLGMQSYGQLYFTILQMPEVSFQQLMDKKQPAACALVAHHLAITTFVTALSSSTRMGNPSESMGKCMTWIESLCSNLENLSQWEPCVRWPLVIARVGGATVHSGRATAREYLQLMKNEPQAFTEGQESWQSVLEA